MAALLKLRWIQQNTEEHLGDLHKLTIWCTASRWNQKYLMKLLCYPICGVNSGLKNTKFVRINWVRSWRKRCVLRQPILTRHVTKIFFFFSSLKPWTLSPSVSLLSSPDLSISGSYPWPPWPELQSSTQAPTFFFSAKKIKP